MKASVVSLLMVFGIGLMVTDANASLPNEYERISLASITDAALEERSQNDMQEPTQVASNDRNGYYIYNAEPVKKSDHQAIWVAAVSLLLLLSIGVLHHLSLRAVARSTVFQHIK